MPTWCSFWISRGRMISRPLSLLAVLSVLASPAWAQDCGEPTSSSDLTSVLVRAEASYSDLDVDGFNATMAEAHALVPCLKDGVTRHLAAELHRFEGLKGFLDGNPGQSTIAFAAARSIEPDYDFPETLVPAGNPVRDDYAAVDPTTGKVIELGEKEAGWIQIDGRQGLERSASFPAFIQLFDDGGSVEASAYLGPTEAMLPYEVKPAPPEPIGEAPPDAIGSVTKKKSARVPMLVGAVAGLAASAGLYGGALASNAAYYDDDKATLKNIGSLRTQTNTLVVASGATAAVSAGVGVTALFVARW